MDTDFLGVLALSNTAKWPRDTMSTVHFPLQNLLDDTGVKGYIARVGWRSGQTRFLGASDRESVMLPQELIALKVRSIGTRAEANASHLSTVHASKDLRHSFQLKTTLQTLERYATSTKRNSYCPGLIIRSPLCHVPSAQHAAPAWMNSHFW